MRVSKPLLLSVIGLLTVAACSTNPLETLQLGGTSGVPVERSPASEAPRQAPSEAPVDTFKPITLTGKGAKVPRFTIPATAAAIATISAKGSDNFAVTSLAADGSDNELLVNVIGNYAGTVLFDAQDSEHSVAFRIETSDSWTITIKPVASARTWDGDSKLSGKGDDVVQINPASSGLIALNITNKGQDNFVVTGYSDNGPDLMVNEIGNYIKRGKLWDACRWLGHPRGQLRWAVVDRAGRLMPLTP